MTDDQHPRRGPRKLPSRMKEDPHIRLSMLFFEDAQDEGLSDASALLYLRMVTRSRQLRSDGRISEAQIAALGVGSWRRHLKPLITVGWVNPLDGTPRRYAIPAYPAWNLLEADFERKRHEGRVGGCRRAHPQPCARPTCGQSQAWLAEHSDPQEAPIT